MTDHWYITDWKEVTDDEQYVVFPINARGDKSLYLGQPSVMKGWQVKRLRERCYAALPMPPFSGLPERTVAH